MDILLVEDDLLEVNQLSEAIESADGLELIGITNNSSKALEYICDYLPDIVILDLELLQGSGSGLTLLTELNDISLSKIPYILVTTNNTSSLTMDYAHQYGADYIMSKHQTDYSAKSVVNFIQMVKPIINKKHKKVVPVTPTETTTQLRKRTTRRIISELNIIGINPKSVGFIYLVDAINIMIEHKTQNISSIIAQTHGKTDASVERAMQNAINRAWRTNNIDELYEHYKAPIASSKGVPTVTEFICYYANLIKNDY